MRTGTNLPEQLLLAAKSSGVSSAAVLPRLGPNAVAFPGRGGHSSGERAAALGAFVAAMDRLEQVVEQETTSLEQHRPTDLRDFNARKSHGLLELSRTMRAIDGLPADDLVAERLGRLRERLERNRAVLKTHMDAVQEIASMMSEAIQDAESDGTYSATSRLAAVW